MHRMCTNEGPFAAPKIREAVSERLDVSGLKPGSWTIDRHGRAVLRTAQDTGLEIRPQLGIKDEALECLGKNKPRFLTADGDEGQVAATFVIGIFRQLWNEWRDGRHIKKQAKPMAMRMVDRLLSTPGTKVSGDGSAWDSCCNATYRNDTENIIYWRIMEVISEHPLFIQHTEDAHSALRCSPLLKLSIRDGDNGNFKKVIDAIRRSGSQETTDGNGFATAVGWAVVNTGQPFELLNGIRVASRWNMSYESDEASSCATVLCLPHLPLYQDL